MSPERSPRPLPDIGHRHYDYWRYRDHTWRFFEPMLARMHPVPPVLDIGAGLGLFLECCRHHGLDSVGVELSVEGIRACGGRGLPVVRADLIERFAASCGPADFRLWSRRTSINPWRGTIRTTSTSSPLTTSRSKHAGPDTVAWTSGRISGGPSGNRDSASVGSGRSFLGRYGRSPRSTGSPGARPSSRGSDFTRLSRDEDRALS